LRFFFQFSISPNSSKTGSLKAKGTRKTFKKTKRRGRKKNIAKCERKIFIGSALEDSES
jgi:hypothetical protein